MENLTEPDGPGPDGRDARIMSRSQPPPPATVKNIQYPAIPSRQLDNGLTLLVIEDRHLPKVSIRLACPVGRVGGPDDNLAVAELGPELVKEGTESRDSRQISESMDQWAIQFESEVFMEYTLFSMTVLEDQLNNGLDLLSDMVLHPVFPEAEVEKLKVRWRSNLVAQRSDPGFLANERTFHTLFAGHPYSRVSIPLSHLEQCGRDSIQDFHRRHIVPEGSFLVLAGAIGEERAWELARKFFGSWGGAAAAKVQFPAPPALKARRVSLVHRPHSVQARIMVGQHALPQGDPGVRTLKVANQVLGGGGSARLFLNLREDKGYTYGAYSVIRSYGRDGVFMALADVRTEVASQSIGEVLKELEGIRKSAPGEQEMARARAELTGSFIRQLQTPGRIASLELNRRLYRLPEDHYRNFIPDIQNISAESVLEISREVFDPEHALLTVVGDRALLEEPLSRLGTVEIYDVAGNPI